MDAQFEELKTLIKKSIGKNPYEMFSLKEASEEFNISIKKITAAVNNKEIPEYDFGDRQRTVRRKDIEAWIDKKKKIEVALLRAKDYVR